MYLRYIQILKARVSLGLKCYVDWFSHAKCCLKMNPGGFVYLF